MTTAVENYGHMNSWAAWMILVFGGGALAAAAYFLMGRDRKGLAILCLIGIVASGVGSYLLYSSLEGSADARDRYVIGALKAGGVKFIDFEDEDTERVRVGIGNCSASFDVVLDGYRGKWPLQRGSGTAPSKGCNLDDVKDTGSRFDQSDVQAYYLDKKFVPHGQKFALAG